MRRTITALAVASALTLTLASAPSAWAANQRNDVPEAAVVEFAPADEAVVATAASSSGKSGAQAKVTRITRESQHARGSKAALDRKGFEKSLYRGKWYMPKKEQVRRCIMKRESGHNYRAVSRGGHWRGAYQMSKPLARGATWMMTKEVRREMGAEGVAIVKKLRKTPHQTWNRYWQDRAFWTIWAKGDGKHHWRGGGKNCFRR